MTTGGVGRWFLALGVVGALAWACGGALATEQQPDGVESPWGADDQRGAANRLTPAKVLEALDLIANGQVYQLGRVYEPGLRVRLHLHAAPTEGRSWLTW